jgi:hypothetical protein
MTIRPAHTISCCWHEASHREYGGLLTLPRLMAREVPRLRGG